MFCKNCGQRIEDGHAFCGNCGLPVPAAGAAPVAQIKPPAPQTPPSAAVPPAPQTPPSAAVPPAPQTPPSGALPPPPVMPAYGTGWQPPQGPGGHKRDGSGLILGIVAAAVIVLAGIGAGVYFGFFYGDNKDSAENGGAVTTRTTVVDTSTTTTGATGTSTVSSAGTSTTVGGGNTTQTVPGLGASTSGTGASGRTTTTTTEDIYEPYLAISQALAAELAFHDQRMPELAAEINNTLPRVPEWVSDELDAMLGILSDLNGELAMLSVPVEYETSLSWLEKATDHMVARIQATILGIEAARSAGNANSATGYFDTGRKERDAYRAAFEEYLAALPPD